MLVPSFAAIEKSAAFLLILTFICCPFSAAAVNDPPADLKNLLDWSQLNVTWKEFEIKFANLRQPYNVAVFPSDNNVCDNARLFVFIPTRPTSFGIRRGIRETWAKNLPPGVVLKFVVGRHAHPDFVYMLIVEQQLYGDLLINDIEDTYLNLYLKVYSAFEWQQSFCNKVDYVLKVDDDAVVDLNRLMFWIDNKFTPMKENQSSIIFGKLAQDIQPIRTIGRKWYVPSNLFSGSLYPPYTPGFVYLLSNEAVAGILSAAPDVKAFVNEDALYTGVIAEKKGIARIDASEHFKNDQEISNECDKAFSVPLVVSIYGFSKADDFAPAYRALNDLECK